MSAVTFTLIDQSFKRKIIILQNLFLLISVIALMIAFVLSLFHNDILSVICTISIIVGLIFALACIICVIIPTKTHEIGTATVIENVAQIVIGRKEIKTDVEDVKIMLNVSGALINNISLNKESIINLADWGNYIVIQSGENGETHSIEFEPNANLLELRPMLQVVFYKNTSTLQGSTKSLFDKMAWTLWGAS